MGFDINTHDEVLAEIIRRRETLEQVDIEDSDAEEELIAGGMSSDTSSNNSSSSCNSSHHCEQVKNPFIL